MRVCTVAEREYVAGSNESSPRESRCEKQGSKVKEKEARESSQRLINFFSFLVFLLFVSLFTLCVFTFTAFMDRFVV